MTGRVAVVGGGLAGLAAGCALADAGFSVTLLERRPYLGGRASSYEHPGTSEVVDNCQHVLLGCCTNLIDFYRRTGVEGKIRWYSRLVFIEPGGRRSVIEPGWLPAPLHSFISFMRAPALRASDKLAIARALAVLARGVPESDENFLGWLRAHGQTEGAIERFWKVVLVSALNEDLERASVKYAGLVFRESFLKSPEAGRMGLPAVPLTELYGAAGEYISTRGGEVRLRANVSAVRPHDDQVKLCAGGEEKAFDYVVLATPWHGVPALLPEDAAGVRLRDMLSGLEPSPITGVHFWFDRQITDLDHAVLLDRTIQWMFHKSRIFGRERNGSYVELVISSSKELVKKSREEILKLAMTELGEFFSEVKAAKVMKSAVIKEVNATFAPRADVDAHRPGQRSGWSRLILAGDWTQTGWPSTMEGAVRSGYLAAEVIAGRKFLVGDLPARGLMGVW